MATNEGNLGITLEKGVEELIRRFDIIIALLMERAAGGSVESSGGATKGGKAEARSVRLAKLGFRPIEIARLTGRHESNVNRDLSKARKIGALPKARRRSRPAKSTSRAKRARR